VRYLPRAVFRPRIARVRHQQRVSLGNWIVAFYFCCWACVRGATTVLYVFQQRLEAATEFARQLTCEEEPARIREELVLSYGEEISVGGEICRQLQKFGLAQIEKRRTLPLRPAHAVQPYASAPREIRSPWDGFPSRER